MSITAKLCAIQSALKSPKDQRAQKYRYRSIEAVNEAVKPLAAEQGCAVIYRDDMQLVDGRLACMSTCTLTDGEEQQTSTAFCLVDTDPKNMSIEQACGAASSYARKYAACGLFAIDDSRDDPDRREADRKPEPDALASAKQRLAAACRAYADVHGLEHAKIMEGVTKRPDYQENKQSAAWFEQVAEEFESEAR